MTEQIKYIPARLKTAVKGGHVTGSEDIDAGGGKTQQQINNEASQSTAALTQRVADLEAMEQIVIDGGEAQIATGSDFTNPDATKRAKLPTVGAVADVFGSYIDNPEFIDVKLDANGHILWAIKADGTVYYGAGVPPQVIDYIRQKIEELSLDEYEDIVDFLNGLEEGENTLQQLLNLKVNKANPELTGKISFDKEIDENDEVIEASVQHVSNPEFVAVWLDKDKNILFGVQSDGNFLFGCGVPQQIIDFVNNIANAKVDKVEAKSLINENYASGISYVDNPEFVHAVIDNTKKLLEGIKTDGTKVIGGNLEVAGGIIFNGKSLNEELAGKVNVEEGKELSSNDYTNEDKAFVESATKGKLMKVVINALEGEVETQAFYIRTKYNSEKDIIIVHKINGNTLITFSKTYIGAKTLTDEQIMTNIYLVSIHEDSTAPLFQVKQYWHLFAQHGYPIPYVANTVNMTQSDIGAKWKDQLDREFIIGNVTSSYIYLLPVIYQDANGHNVRDWKNTANSQGITALTHVSGGVITSNITVTSTLQTQLKPIMKHENRKWFADGVEVNEAGVYFCNEFKVSESQIGYDPATVLDWFGNNGNPVLDNAQEMARFTWSYNYCGAQCCMNTTIDIRREVECDSYGAILQQFFLDTGEYKAMFMIPKAADREGGVVLDKPFHSPSTQSPGYTVYRHAYFLKDVDDPIDRMIGFLYKESDDSYLVGMAAGLSLVSGDTVKTERNNNCLVGTGSHYRLGSISPSNNNKFYVAAINTSPFEDNQYYFPNTYFKEINCYVSYFDPAENVGQVYWYKDGNSYIIYCHCQNIQNRLAINVPKVMEGLNLSVIEKTTDTELLTDTVTNCKFYVNYNSNDSNYIVLKTN